MSRVIFQFCAEALIATAATFAGFVITAAVQSLGLAPGTSDWPGYAALVLWLSAPAVAAGVVDRRIRILGPGVFIGAPGPLVAVLGGAILYFFRLVPDNAAMALGIVLAVPATGMLVYGGTRLILRVIYRNRPIPPPRTGKTPALESLRLGTM